MASSFSCKVCLRLFLCLLTWPAYLLFLHSFEIPCYVQIYCILYMLKTCSVFPLLLLKTVLSSSKGCVPSLSSNWVSVICAYTLGAFVLFLCLHFWGTCMFHRSLCIMPSFTTDHRRRSINLVEQNVGFYHEASCLLDSVKE